LVEVGSAKAANGRAAPPGEDAPVEEPAVLGGDRRRQVGCGVLVPPLAQLADRAGAHGVLALVDLGDEPTEGDLGIAAGAPYRPRDVVLLAGVGVAAGEGAHLPGLLAPLA